MTETQSPTTHLSPLARLARDREALADELTARIQASEASYHDSSLSTGQLRESVRDNISGLLAALSDPAGASTAAAVAAGRLKAQQGIPLDSLLHAYRLGGLIVWERLAQGGSTEELVPLASRLWASIDRYSSSAAEAYRQHASEQRQRALVSREVLLTALLDEPAARGDDIVRELGLPAGGEYVVLAADLGDRLPALLAHAAKAGIAAVSMVSTAGQFALATAGPHTSPQRLAAQAVGFGRIGLSRAYPASHLAPAAKREAVAAQRCVPASGAQVYGADPLALVVTADREAADSASAEILGGLAGLTAEARSVLLETLWAWFDAGGSTSSAAKNLHCHRNTVLYRLNQIAALTGRSTNNPRGTAELYLALTAAKFSH